MIEYGENINKMSKKKINYFKDLEEKIVSSNIFMVLGTSNYAKDLKKRNSQPYIQSMIAKNSNKPVFIVFLKGKIREEEKIEIERFYSSYNVAKEIDIDIHSDKGIKELAESLKCIIKGKCE